MTNIKITFTIGLLGIVSLAFNACKKDEDTEKPTLAVVEPLAGDTLFLSQDPEIHIEFTASDNEELHEVSINLKDANGNVFLTKIEDVDQKTFSFHEHVTPTLTTGVEFTLNIEADDHSGNSNAQEIKFFVLP
jgi:hypothetical protein